MNTKLHIANSTSTTTLQYFHPVTPMYPLFSKAKRKHGLLVLLPDYRKAVCCIIFEGQFRCWLVLSILISVQKCFSDNSCLVLDINVYLFPTGKILTCRAAKKRASINGTDLGMRTLTKEPEVPSNPKRCSPSPWLPLPMNCSTLLQPHGGRAQTPARTSQRREGSVPTSSDWHRALTFVKENLWELLNIQKTHKRNTERTNSRTTKRTETTSGFRSLQDTDDWEVIWPVLDLLLRHSLLVMISYYPILKQMFLLDLTQYSLLVRQLISKVAAQGVLTVHYRQAKQKKIHENLFMTLLQERPYHLEAIANHWRELSHLGWIHQDIFPQVQCCASRCKSRQRCKQIWVGWYVAKNWRKIPEHSTDKWSTELCKRNEKKIKP